jgi:polyribonucleotide 5'-hydroxyl-kinase
MESGGSKTQQTFDLRPEDELRIEAGSVSVRIELVDGTAELRGCELAQGSMSKLYEYSISNFCGYIFTWEGCRILIDGPCECYIVRDTFTRGILNIHSDLQDMRELASRNEGKLESVDMGPRVMVVGPPGSGRSTVAMTLLNYAARLQPMVYVDLDVGLNDISLSGMLSAVVVDKPVSLTRGWAQQTILSFPFGSSDISANSQLYQLQLVQILKSLEARDETFPSAKSAGWIVRGPSFDSKENYEALLETIKAVAPHVVVVLGYDRLVHGLNTLLEDRIDKKLCQIVNLSRSGGVLHRGPQAIQTARQLRIRDYFYGSSRELGPARISLPFGEKFVVVQLRLQDQISITAMPIDQEAPPEAELEVFQLPVDRQLRHHLLAVSYAHSIEQVLFSNIVGYVHVIDVDLEKGKLICTSPLERIETGSSGPIYLIKTDFVFTDVE